MGLLGCWGGEKGEGGKGVGKNLQFGRSHTRKEEVRGERRRKRR